MFFIKNLTVQLKTAPCLTKSMFFAKNIDFVKQKLEYFAKACVLLSVSTVFVSKYSNIPIFQCFPRLFSSGHQDPAKTLEYWKTCIRNKNFIRKLLEY